MPVSLILLDGVRWQGDDGTIEISSDQLFQMMFMVGNLAPTHCLMLALFCGVLPHDISIYDLKDSEGRTPLSWAADNGHEAVFKLLLETGKVDVDSKDSGGRTPRSRAALNGNEAVVKLLQSSAK